MLVLGKVMGVAQKMEPLQRGGQGKKARGDCQRNSVLS